MPPPTEATLRATAHAFLSAFETLSPESHISLRAPTCIQIFAPSSLNPPTPKTNTQFSTHITSLSSILSSFPVVPKEIHVHAPGLQVFIWATGVPVFKEEVKKEEDGQGYWEYEGEYVFLLDFDAEGRIVRVLEFLDSKGTERLRGLIGRARERVGLGGPGF